MEVDQATDSYLPKMPVLVIEKILAHISNLSNVSLTCKFLYKIVCDTDRYRRVMHIRGTKHEMTSVFDGARLTIDDDAMFYSITNSLRTIKQIKLRGDWKLVKRLQLNERQLFRLTAIVKIFGANITSLELDGFTFSINTIIELLQQTPRLESLILANGAAVWADMEDTRLQLSNLKTLEFSKFLGRLYISRLVPAGSLNYFRLTCTQSTKLIQKILTEHRNIKALHLDGYFHRNILRVNHLQLETLIFGSQFRYYCTDDDLMRILQWHLNLKELKIAYARLSVSCFEWICNNLKKLEVLEIHSVKVSILSNNYSNVLGMLAELKKLRHFRTTKTEYFIGNGSCDSLEKLEIVNLVSYGCGRLLNTVINSMVQSFANLTDLGIELYNFAALSVVLRQCTTLISISSRIEDPSPHPLTQQHFPNVQHLTLTTRSWSRGKQLSQSINAVVHAVPNLKSLSVPFCSLMFNVNLMEEFINGCKRLNYFSVECFELQRDLTAGNFFEIIRRLSDQLKGFQLTFKSHGLLNSDEINQILSNEFIDQHGVVHADESSRFCLHKRDRSDAN